MADPLDDFFASGSAVAAAKRDPARDPLDDYFAGDTRDKANLAITATRSANPETAARANVLARDTGLPPETVERNLDAVTREQQAIQNRRIIQSNPNLANWATDPRHAAVAQDDLPGLAAVGAKAAKGAPKAPSESMFGPEGFSGFVGNLIPDIGKSLYAGALRAGAGLYGALAATAEVRDPLNYLVDAAFRDGRPDEWRGRVASFIRSQAVEPITREADSARPDNRGFVGNSLLSGFESMPQAIAAVALTAAGGPGAGAAALVPMFGAPTFGEEYGKARGQGLEPGEAALYGARQGAVEVITESLPMLFAAKALGKVPFREFLMGYAGKELPSELLATTLQSFDEWVTLNPEKPVAEWLDNLPNELAQTALATLTGSGSMAAISETARVGAEFVDRRQQKAQAQADAEYLADMAAGVADNKTRKRDPSAFAKFMASQMADTGNETTFINAEALRTLYQQQGMDPLQSGNDPLFGWLDSFQRQMQQALASGGEVAVPTAEFLTRFAGTPAWEALKADIRISPDGVSLNEAKTMADGDQARAQLLGAQVAERMAKRQAEAAPAKAIYAEVTRRLAATGMAGDQLKTNAALWTQRAVTRGRRLGVDPLALFLSDNIQVERDFGDGMVATTPVAAPTPSPTTQPNPLEPPPKFDLAAAMESAGMQPAPAAAETPAVAEPAPSEVAAPEVERLAQRYAEMLSEKNGENSLNTRVSDFHRNFTEGIVNRNASALGLAWSNLNPTARRLFEETTGVKLPKGQAASREAIYAWAGADLAADTAAEDAARASRLIEYEIESARRPASFVKINFDGVSLTGVEFVDARIAEGFTVEKLRNNKTYLINRSTEQAFDLSAKGMAEIGRYARAVLAQRGPIEEPAAEIPPIADEPMPAATNEVPRDLEDAILALGLNDYVAYLEALNPPPPTNKSAITSRAYQISYQFETRGEAAMRAALATVQPVAAQSPAEQPPQAPAGPRVIVNIVGSDGLTDAERGGPLVINPPVGAGNTAFTQGQFDKDAAALDDWFRQLDQGPAPMVEPGTRVLYQSMPPEVMSAGIRAAGYFIEGGSRDYATYTEAMTARFGPKAGPYLRSWYEAVRYSPDAATFAGEMTSAAEIEAPAAATPAATSEMMTPDAMRTILEDGGQAEVNGTLYSVAEARNGTWTVKTRGKNEPIGFQRGPGPFETWAKSYAIEEAVKDAFPATRASQSAMEPANVDATSLPERVEGTSPTDLSATEQGGQTDGVRGPEDAGSGTPDQRPVERPPGERPERAPDGRGAGAGNAAGSAAGIANVEAAPDGTGGDGATGDQPGNDSGPRPTRTPVPARVVAGSNYVIEPGALSESRGWKQKARDNIAAIRLMQDIMRAGRLATPEEQAVLARYVGFGGLSKLFPDSAGAYGEGWESLGAELRALLNDEEYRTALQSIQYAHYTSETIVRGMWEAAEKLGFKGGQIFEPGMGIGNFPGLMPASLRATSHYAGLEMDRVSANIAKLLYPTYGIKQADFIETTVGKDAYDLVIGNPPFADIAIKGDPAYRKQGFLLHDFFFAKSLDALKPGGLLLFVTSAGTMNKIDAKARHYMADRADLVASMRLPGDAFKENAGTQVTTDIIILRKRMPGEKPGDQAWRHVENVTLPGPDKSPMQGVMNAYFVANPEQVLGEQGFFDKLYQGRYAVRTAPDRNWAAEFEAAIARLPSNIAGSIASSSVEKVAAAPALAVTQWSSEKKEGSFYTSSGNLYQTQSGKGVPVLPRGKAGGSYTAAEIERIAALVPVRDALRNVLRFDMAGDMDNASVARVQLNEAYEAFVAKFGPINKAEITEHKPTASQIEEAWQEAREDARAQGMPWDDGSFDPSELVQQRASMTAIAKARAAARDAAKARGDVWSDGSFDPSSVPNNIRDKRPNIEPFMDDPESYRLRAIEHYDDNTGKASKGPVFLRSAFLEQRQPKIESPADALAYVMGTKGKPDMDEIARLSGVTVEAAAEALKGAVFLQPGSANTWLTRGKYLSGNVREKLREAQEAVQTDSRLMNNVEALAAVQPAMLSPAEIGVTIGMPWVPGKVYERFAGQHLGLGNVAVGYSPAISTFAVTGSSWSAAATSTWGTGRMNAIEIMQALLNRTSVRVFDRTSDDKLILNEIETQAAQDKARAITEEFDLWLNNNSAIADQLAAIYNERFNNSIAPQYDGSWITTPGIAQGWSWRPHQRRVIARIIEAGNTYMAHAVGAGKTSAMIASGMEMRRLGLVKKPMYVVPNHMLGQFTKEFYEQYPAAKIAVADERQFHTDKRRQFMANAALDDLDAIIITHASFKKIPISAELEGSIIDEQIEMLEDALREDLGGDRQTQSRTRKQIQKAIQRLSERLKGKRLDKQDRVMTFEEMGVDFLFVDEAHLFRKLDFSTKMTQVKGIAPEGSKASFDLYAKIRHLRRLNPQRHLVMASGTPITNTMAELYSLQRFMQEDALRAQNLGHFDAWAGTYGTTVSALEADAAGGFKTVTRFAKFVNVPELSIMVRQVMDVVTDAQLSQYVVRPGLKGGKRIFHGSPRGEMLTNYQSALADRMRIIQQRKGGKPQPGDDIMLNVINDGRHAAIDMRLVDPALGANGSKLDLLVNEVFRVWQETTNQPFFKVEGEGYAAEPYTRGPAAQMIFANLGVGGARQFNVVDHITRELVARGVPKKEIAFIANYDTAIEKQRLFNDVNDGKVRIMIGSVAKMGAGVNAQRRLAAIHNLDPLWYPADDTQRNGRGIRQGNQNREIEIHNYAAIDTYDAAMWGMMERKARFIEAFMAGDPSVRDMEDLGEASMFEQAKAMTISDQRIMQLTEMRQEAETLRRKKSAWESGLYQARSKIANLETQLLDYNAQIVGTQQDIAQRQDIAGDKFSGIVNGKTFTKRAEFGKAASEAAMAAFTTAPEGGKARQIEIGAVGGFPLLALVTKGTSFSNFRVGLRMNSRIADVNATTEEGIAASIGNIVRNLEELLSYQQKREGEITEDIETLRRNSQSGAWQGQADLDRLVADVRALEVELEAEHQAAQAAATASAPVNEEGRTLEQSAPGLPETLTIDGIKRPTTNSNGNSIYSTRQGIEAFWRWFGDSKAVDDEGRPLVVNHGTAGEFDQFSPEKKGSLTDAPSAKAAFWFSSKKRTAQTYANWAAQSTTLPANVLSLYLKIDNPLVHDMKNRVFRDETFFSLVERAKANNHDGVIIKRAFDGGEYSRFDALMRGRLFGETFFAAFDQGQIKSATSNSGTFDPADPRILNQSARGRIRMTGDGTVISLMGTGDESTFLHEMGHRWLEELKTDASGGLSTDQLAGDWQTVKDWFSENGHVVGEDGFIPDEAHELWARGIERYLMEGRAPTNALRAVFQKFATWLKRIYETVEALNTPITPEIRAVMGRLLAADSAVEAQIEAQAAAPLLPDVETAAALGMTAEAHAAYLALAAEAKGDVQAKMLEKMMASVRARRQGQFRDERDKVRADIEAEIAKDPLMVALQLLRTGKRIDDTKAEKLNVRLSRQALVEIFGADVLDTLPRAVPPMIDDDRNPIGVHPDELAEMVGLSSGQALVEGLQKVRQQEQARRESGDKRGFMRGMVEDRIDAIMNERHGGLLSEAEIMAEARDLLANEKQGELYAAELRALSRGTGAGEGGPINTPFRFVRAWASEQMLREKVVNAMTGRFVDLRARTSAKAGREAFDLLAAGDKRGAALAKQRQMVGHALHMEAKQAHDAVTAALSMMKRYARRERAGSIDIEYFDRIKEVLALFGFDSRVPANLEGGPNFLEWAMGQINAGVELQMPRGLAGLAFPTWQQLSVADFLSLADTVRNLAALGRTKNKLIVAGQEVEFEELVAEAEATAEALPARKFSDDWNQQTSRVHQAAAGLLKMEKIADWLDNGNPNGVFNRLLIRGAVDAENTRQRLRESVLVPIAQTFLEADKSHRARWDARFTLPELTDRATGRPAVLTGKEMIAVALNMGNEGNIKRITEGHGWQREAIMEVLNRHLTQQDWQFVQSVWDQIDTLWPEIVRVERAVRGITPEKIEAEPVVTRFGVFRGGYYPVVYDRDRTDVPNNDAGDAAMDMMNQIGSHVTTATGHSISRVDVTAPLLLSLEGVLIGHVQRVVTRIAFAEYARDVLKFVREPRIRRIVRERAGKEYLDQMVPWLRRQVTDGLVDNQGMKGIDRFMRAARVNLTMVAMGLRWSTGIAQAAGLTSSANIIGAKWLAQGMADSLRNRGQITAFVMERSPEMARRNREFDRDVTDFFRSLSGQSSALDKVRGMAFWHIGMIDRHIVAVPTWIGAYKKGLSEGMTESEAAAYGDKAVRTSQGSGRIKDLAAVQAPNSEAYKMFTLFYSYFNVQFNEQWQAAQEVKRGNFHRAMAISWWMLVAAPLSGALLTGDWPDDDEGDGLDMADWAAWAARKLGFGLFAGLPLVRDMASYLERQSSGRYASYSATPLTRVGDSVIGLGRDAKAVAQGDEPSDRWVKHAIETPGYFIGLPTGQVATTSQFLWDVQTGAQSPETVAEWYRGLTKGSVDAR